MHIGIERRRRSFSHTIERSPSEQIAERADHSGCARRTRTRSEEGQIFAHELRRQIDQQSRIRQNNKQTILFSTWDGRSDQRLGSRHPRNEGGRQTSSDYSSQSWVSCRFSRPHATNSS